MICPCCGSRFATVSVFLTHLRLIHSNEAGFQITCGIQGCPRTYVNFHTYRNHVYSIHSSDGIVEDSLTDNPAAELETESLPNASVDPVGESLLLGGDQSTTELFVEETNAQTITSMYVALNAIAMTISSIVLWRPTLKKGLVKLYKKFGAAGIWAAPIRSLHFKFDDVT